jgi:hypothetical protein
MIGIHFSCVHVVGALHVRNMWRSDNHHMCYFFVNFEKSASVTLVNYWSTLIALVLFFARILKIPKNANTKMSTGDEPAVVIEESESDLIASCSASTAAAAKGGHQRVQHDDDDYLDDEGELCLPF